MNRVIEHATLNESRSLPFAPPTKAELTEAHKRGLTRITRNQITELRRDPQFRAATQPKKQIRKADK